MEKSGFYEVLNPQDDFRAVDRFIDKIFGPVGEGAQSGFCADIGGQDQDGEVFVLGDHRLEHLHDRESVKVGHVEIEEHDIGLKLLINLQGEARIGNPTDIGTSVELEDAFEEANVRGFVIHNEDFHAAMIIGMHGVMIGFLLLDETERKLRSTFLEEHLLCLCEPFYFCSAFHRMITEKEKSQSVRSMFSVIAERYDFANHFLSLGLDFFWRRRATKIVAGWKPTRILDLATGSGDLALALRASCPEALMVGADFCLPMLQVAQRKGLSNLVVADGMRLAFASGSFDLLTVAFGLRNMASWSGALAEMARVIRSGGHLLVLDFSVPPPPLRWIYRPYLHGVLPHLAALVTGNKEAYDYLGDSIEKFPCGRAMIDLIEQAGFDEVRAEPMSGGIVTIYTGRRR